MPVIDAMILAFSINAPIQIIITVGQWLLMARFLSPFDKLPDKKMFSDAFSCLALTFISAYFLALFFWLFWPLNPDLILYNNRISIPAILGEAIAMPFWLYQFDYFNKNTNT